MESKQTLERDLIAASDFNRLAAIQGNDVIVDGELKVVRLSHPDFLKERQHKATKERARARRKAAKAAQRRNR